MRLWLKEVLEVQKRTGIFYKIALKSSNETKYWLCLIRDTMAVNRTRVQELLTEANELSKIIPRIIVNAENG